MSNFMTKFVAFTHTKMYTNFITHAPLAAFLVVAFHNWRAFVFASTIGLWKDMLLDVKYGTTEMQDAYYAQAFYVLGAIVGEICLLKF